MITISGDQKVVQVNHAALFEVPVVLGQVLVQGALIVVPPITWASVLPSLQVDFIHVPFHVARLFYLLSANFAPKELIQLLDLGPH